KHISNGKDALDYFYKNESYEKPAFILLDLRLPKVDGFEVLKKLKSDKKFKDIPIIVLSTSNASIDSVRAYEVGANSYLVKPLSFKDFQKQIQDVCKYWIHWNIAPRA
ncbi:MAG: response regulator, partial [Calditrichaeota bacterium]|nr:response regulator [Calditrichota bacterium]